MPSDRAVTQDVEFTPGMRQDFDPVRAPRGALIDAMNVRFGRLGGIRGREGTRAIAPTASKSGSTTPNHTIRNSPDRVGVLGRVENAGILGVYGKLFARDPERAAFDYVGNYSTCRPVRKRQGLLDPNGSVLGIRRHAVAVNAAGYVLVAAGNASSVRYAIESPTGAKVFAGGDFGTKCAALALGYTFYLIIQNGTSLSVRTILLTGADPVLSAPVTFAPLVSSSHYWDVTPAADGVHWYAAFQVTATVLQVERYLGSTVNAANNVTVAGNCPVSLYADSTNVWLGWYNDPTVTGDVRYRTYAPSLTSTRSAITTIVSGANVYGPPLMGPSGTSGTAQFVYRHSNGSSSPYTVSSRWGTATSPGSSVTAGTVDAGASSIAWHGVPISKPDSGRRFWMMLGCQAAGWQTQRAVLVRMDNSDQTSTRTPPTVELVYAQTEMPHAANLASTVVDMFHHVAEGASAHFFAVPQLRQRSQSTNTNDLIGIDVLEYMPSSIEPHRQAVELGSSSMVTGQPVEIWGHGFPVRDAAGAAIDSRTIGAAEVGFVHPPAVLTATEVAGGNLTASGSYRWLFIFSWSDLYGRRHRSAPSAVHTIATLGGGNQQVTFSVASLQLSQKQGALLPGVTCSLEVYRTVSAGSTFYRETTPGVSVSANSVATGEVAWTSGSSADYSDASISANERLYTDGGVKQNDIAPSCIFSCESEERVWLGGLWDGSIIQASKIRVPGEPTQFTDHESHQVVIPDNVTGLAYLDGAVIAFARNAIYAVTGDGPNDQGAGSFNPPRALSRDIGCVDYKSIVETAQGILFKSARGFYLLPRGLGQPIHVGAAVQKLTSQIDGGFDTVLGAAAFQNVRTRTARFLLSSGSAEIVLVYDLDIAANDPLNGWSYDLFADRLQAIGTWPDGCAMAKRDLSSATHALYLDETVPSYAGDASDTQAITTAIETAELRPAGVAGWWQCSVVAAAMSQADAGSLTMTVTTDGDSGAPSESVGGPWTLSGTTTYQYRFVHPEQPQCTAAKVRLSCVRSTGVYGPIFHGLTIEQMALPSVRRAIETER